MAKCGDPLYDGLPATVYSIDVDAARYALRRGSLTDQQREKVERQLNVACYLHYDQTPEQVKYDRYRDIVQRVIKLWIEKLSKIEIGYDPYMGYEEQEERLNEVIQTMKEFIGEGNGTK